MRKLKFVLAGLLFLIFSSKINAQDKVPNHLSSLKGENTLGVGIGLSYGAIGARFGTNVADHWNLFAGIGYQLVGIGYNLGLMRDFESRGSTQFYLTAMYGTNAAILITGTDEYNQTYTGLSFGAGIKINSRKKEGNFWDLNLLVPIRSEAYKTDENRVLNDPFIRDFTRALPVLFTVGYNFNL